MNALKADRLPHDLGVLVDELFEVADHPDGRMMLQQETKSLAVSADRLGDLLVMLAMAHEVAA